MIKVYCYSRCTTCQKALKWLAQGAQPTETVKAILRSQNITK